MDQYCLDLKFDLPPFKLGTDFSPYTKSQHSNVDESHLNKEFLDFFLSINQDMGIGAFEVFYLPPNVQSLIHVDQLSLTEVVLSDFTKINWVYYGEGSTMNWYTPKEHDALRSKTVASGLISTDKSLSNLYVSFDRNEVDLIHSQPVKFPSMVQAGVPHNIHTGNEHRICVSLTFGSIKEYRRYNWDESLCVLKNFIS